MSFLSEARKNATAFARGDEERAYAPGWAGIPPEDMIWGASPDVYSPDEFGEYITDSNPVYSVVDQRANYLAYLPLRLYRFTGDSAIMQIPRSQGEAMLQDIQKQLNKRLVGRDQVRNLIMGLAQAGTRSPGHLKGFIRQNGLEEVNEGAAYDLLHTVNDFWTMHRLIRMSSLSRDLWGQSYWFVERGPSTRGEPTEIWWVKPTQVRPIPHPELYISHYEYDPISGGEPIPFLPWEVVRIYNPNPIDEFMALSALSSSSIFADHEKDSMEANMNLHRMGLNPGAIVTPAGGLVWESDQARNIEDDINKRLGGVDRAHRWGTFRQEVKIHKTAMSPRDSEFIEGMGYDLEAVARAYDWPIDLLAGKRTYENVEQAFKRAWQTTVMSAAAFAADIAEFYLPMFVNDEILVPYFDSSNIAVLQEVESLKWERERSQIDLVITRNEWRQGRGLGPVPGGDQLFVSTQNVPLEHAEEIMTVEPAPVPLLEDGEDLEEDESVAAVAEPSGNGAGP
jgi:phage portal protein BeeE